MVAMLITHALVVCLLAPSQGQVTEAPATPEPPQVVEQDYYADINTDGTGDDLKAQLHAPIAEADVLEYGGPWPTPTGPRP